MEASGNRHAVTAERLAFGVVCEGFDCGTFGGDDEDDLCVKCQAYAAKIRAALDAAAREALIQLADSMGTYGVLTSQQIRAQADALSGRHEEETKTKS